jgi:hypothetical protein
MPERRRLHRKRQLDSTFYVETYVPLNKHIFSIMQMFLSLIYEHRTYRVLQVVRTTLSGIIKTTFLYFLNRLALFLTAIIKYSSLTINDMYFVCINIFILNCASVPIAKLIFANF